MEYLQLGRNKVSRLGFGCMRLPYDGKNVDIDASMVMVDKAIEAGVNYLDTAYVYLDGNSETFVREVIKKYGREKLFIADKLPIYFCKEEADLDKYLAEQLERLGTDYIDYYLFHALNPDNFSIMEKSNYKNFIKRNMDNGKIRNIGFSFHAELELFKKIIDDYDWDFCQIQFNYVDVDYQAGLAGLKYAEDKNIPVIVMEPIRGGRLARVPENVRNVFDNSRFSDEHDAIIALRYVANFSGVSCILSGMMVISDVEANVKLFTQDLVDDLSEKDLLMYVEAKREFENISFINCTGCDYCKEGCPKQIPISEIFANYNKCLNSFPNGPKKWYGELEHDATSCIACKKCEKSCPQNLAIIEKLKLADQYFKS